MSQISVNSYYATICLGLTQVLGCILGTLAIGRIGRRGLLILSSLCSFFCMTGLSLTLWLRHLYPDGDVATALSWLPLVWLVLFTLAFMVGLGPVPWVLLGELFPGLTSN